MKEPTAPPHCSSTRKCPAEGDRAGWSPGPCSLVPEHLLHWWPQFYTSSFRHFVKQLFKQKPAVSHLDYSGEKLGQHTETLPRDCPSPITFTHFQLQKRSSESRSREKANETLKCGSSIHWFLTISPITSLKMNMAIVSGQYLPKDVI